MEFNRFFKIRLTSPNNSIIYEIDGNTPGTGISAGTMKLDELLCDSELEIGAYTANKFEVQIYGLTVDVAGYTIEVYDEYEEGNPIYTFVGKIDSSESDKFNRYRTIIAYDAMYWVKDIDVGNFWKSFWSINQTATLQHLRDAICNYVGLTIAAGQECYNDNLLIQANDDIEPDPAPDGALLTSRIEPFTTSSGDYFLVSPSASTGPSDSEFHVVAPLITQVKFSAILRMICELQICCPNINRRGELTFVTIGANEVVVDVEDQYDTNQATFQDYITDTPTGFAVYDTSAELAQMVPNNSQNTNPYPISGNVFLLTMTAQQILVTLAPLLSTIQSIVYNPASVPLIVSDLGVHPGDKITTTRDGQTYTHIVLSQSFSGAQLVDQTIESPAYGKKLNSKGSSVNNLIAQGVKFSQIKHDIDGIELRVGQVVDDSGNIKSAEIILAINDDTSTVGISADKVDITGTVTLKTFTDGMSSGTTVINGGCIETGTLNASAITAGTLVVNVEDSSDRVIFKADAPNELVTIGGFQVNYRKIYGGDGSNIKTVVMQAPENGSVWVFAAGGADHGNYSDCPFRVSADGELYATDAHIKGEVTATSGTFTGTVNANAGTIGGCTISNGTLTINNANINSLSVSKLTTGTCSNSVTFSNSNSSFSGTMYSSANSSLLGTMTGTLFGNNNSTYSGQLNNGIILGTHGEFVINVWDAEHGIKGVSLEYGGTAIGYASTYIKMGQGSGGATLTLSSNTWIELLSSYMSLSVSNSGSLHGTWTSDSPITTSSDKNKKNTIDDLDDMYSVFFDNLRPVTFKYNDGTSDRLHIGFIAQDVETALKNSKIPVKNFGGYVIIEQSEEITYGLRYEEFIALNTREIQKLKARIAELERKI